MIFDLMRNKRPILLPDFQKLTIMQKTFQIIIAAFVSTWLFSCAGSNSEKENSGTVESEWKMGAALYSFNRFPFAETLAKADSGDIKYVEGFSFHKMGGEFGDKPMGKLNDEEIAKVKQLLANHDLSMPSVYFGNGKDLEEWKANFELAKKLNLQYIVAEPDPIHWDMLDSLAGEYNIKLAIHDHAQGESKYWHPDSVKTALAGRPNFGVCADVGHWVRSGLDPVKCLEDLSGHILGVHLKDVDESGNKKANNMVVGQGVIDFKGISQELTNQKFKGYIFIEREANWDNNLPDVVEAIRYFKNISKSEKISSKTGAMHKPGAIKHMVIFDLKHEKGSEEAKRFLQNGVRMLGPIPGVEEFKALNQISPKNDYTYGFSMVFENEQAYENYNNHPVHVDFVENLWKKEVTRFLEIDFNLFNE